jgi:glycosyltransferase involved in cell wall biosynthesis
MAQPLVSVICLCYNHARFVEEAVRSVLDQHYENIEIVIVDDASSDNSRSVIDAMAVQYPQIRFIPLEKNIGNCRAFNEGLRVSHGEFVIDFATDDVMMPGRIQKQIDLFASLPEEYGVVFTNAIYIDENGKTLRNHYDHLFTKGLLRSVPQGDVYSHLLSTYFVSSPTMLVKRKVFDVLGGYDGSLSYEDFDFWIRSSRYFKYGYLDDVTTKVRITQRSMSQGWYRQGDKQLYSTYLVCKKALELNRSDEDRHALISRLKYEIRQSVLSGNTVEAKLFFGLLAQMEEPSVLYKLLIMLNSMRLPLWPLRKIYHRLRYGV